MHPRELLVHPRELLVHPRELLQPPRYGLFRQVLDEAGALTQRLWFEGDPMKLLLPRGFQRETGSGGGLNFLPQPLENVPKSCPFSRSQEGTPLDGTVHREFSRSTVDSGSETPCLFGFWQAGRQTEKAEPWLEHGNPWEAR